MELEIEVGGGEALLVGGLRQDDAPGVDDRGAAVGTVMGRRLSNLVGADNEDFDEPTELELTYDADDSLVIPGSADSLFGEEDGTVITVAPRTARIR